MHFGIASVVVMPLVRGEEVYGVFELLSGRPRAFEERDFVALNRLAEMIQTAVEHADAARRAEIELARPAVATAKLRPQRLWRFHRATMSKQILESLHQKSRRRLQWWHRLNPI